MTTKRLTLADVEAQHALEGTTHKEAVIKVTEIERDLWQAKQQRDEIKKRLDLWAGMLKALKDSGVAI